MKRRDRYTQEQNPDAIIRRLWHRCCQVIAAARAAGMDEGHLHFLESDLETRAKRVYTRVTDRHPDRIGM